MGPPLIERWLECASGWDIESLLDLYHPDAVIEAGRRVEGRPAIKARLQRFRRKFSDLTLHIVEGPRGNDDRWTFTTDVTARTGRWMIRHVLQCQDGVITRHGVEQLPLEPSPMPLARRKR